MLLTFTLQWYSLDPHKSQGGGGGGGGVLWISSDRDDRRIFWVEVFYSGIFLGVRKFGK